jgi:hypothetical protein
LSKRANKRNRGEYKEPQWKTPKLRSDKTKRFKEDRPKHVRATQDPAWLNLRKWFLAVRYKTLKQCGLSEQEIEDYMYPKHQENSDGANLRRVEKRYDELHPDKKKNTKRKMVKKEI